MPTVRLCKGGGHGSALTRSLLVSMSSSSWVEICKTSTWRPIFSPNNTERRVTKDTLHVAWSGGFISVYIAVLCCNFLFLSFPSIAKFVDSKLRAGNKVNQNKE